MISALALLHPPPPALLAGQRVAVVGSGGGLGQAIAAEMRAAGAEVLGIDHRRSFGPVDALYRAGPEAAESVARALPDGLSGLVLAPDLAADDPVELLLHGLVGPIRLAEALAPRLAAGAAIVVRTAAPLPERASRLADIRAARALRPEEVRPFAARFGLLAEPARTIPLIGWAIGAWALSRAQAWPKLRINAVLPAAPDGRLPPAQAAHLGLSEVDGVRIAARAVLLLLSPLAAGLTGVTLACDGGLSARVQCLHEGL